MTKIKVIRSGPFINFLVNGGGHLFNDYFFCNKKIFVCFLSLSRLYHSPPLFTYPYIRSYLLDLIWWLSYLGTFERGARGWGGVGWGGGATQSSKLNRENIGMALDAVWRGLEWPKKQSWFVFSVSTSQSSMKYRDSKCLYVLVATTKR